MDGVVLGIDLGGSSIKWATVDGSGAVSEVAQRTTPRSPEALLGEIDKIVAEAGDRAAKVHAVCLGTPGPVDENGAIRGDAVNLENWGDRPLQEHLSARLRLPVAVKNDTNLAIFGESLRGAARDRQDVLGVFIGTGIGGGLYLRGSLYAGHGGLAGEIGHSVVNGNGPQCPCGQRGCLERYASATGLRERAQAEARGFDSPLALEVQRTGTGPSVAALASHLAEGEPFAVHLVQNAAEALAHVIGLSINLIAPEMVVVGGGVTEGIPELVSRIAQALPRYTLPATHAQTRLEPALLGHRAGAIGAALFGLRTFAGTV